jgi:HlyD family secretion protein
MDIPRGEEVARRRRIRQIITGVLIVIVVVATTVALSRLKPAAPTVDRATVLIDTVRRGELIRQVRGLGTLVPEDIRWIPATTQGRVERRLLQPGTHVKADSVILELTNPELEQNLKDAELQLKAAQADYTNLQKQLDTELLNQQAQAATVQAAYNQAKLQAETDAELLKEGLVSELNYKKSKLTAEETAKRNEIEQKRVVVQAESAKARLTAQQAQVDQRRALYELRKNQVDALKVRAGFDGVLQLVPVEVGQQVAPGTNLARVADPTRLKAEIRIPETQVKDVQIGQKATVDTRNGVVEGTVVRIDPAAQAGTFTVDVAFNGPLPPGAKPDINVDGTIECERLENVLYVGRPVQGQPNSTVGLFKLIDGGKEAIRVQVKLGPSSVNTIVILEGLKEGDQVILSDMSAQDTVDRIRLG